MHITKEDIDLLKEGLFDMTSEQNREKMQEIKKRMDQQQRILNRSAQKRASKSGVRFSQDTKAALDEHVQHLRDTADKMKSLSRELKSHAGDLRQKADDLTKLYRNEGQGPAFAED
jgi:hypothetical protein